MPPPYQIPHWNVFAAIAHAPAGPIGYIPATWVANRGLAGVRGGTIPLPTHRLDRAAVRAICQNPANPVLFGYACAMAWGSQGARPGGANHVAAAWNANAAIANRLSALRAGGLPRCAAYNLFLGAGAVPGLGPAYFTKLLYFFSPDPDFYIMDQWTGKSMNLLTGKRIVRMSGVAVSNLNTCGSYQAYCEEIDAMAAMLGVMGDQIEEMMMSKGGRHPCPWRAHVRANWPHNAPTARYNRPAMYAAYPHIPLTCF